MTIKNIAILVAISFVLLAQEADAAKTFKRMLWLGNSLIGHIDGNCGTFPYGIIEELARLEGYLVPDVDVSTRGGAQTTDHVNGIGSAPDWDLDPLYWDNGGTPAGPLWESLSAPAGTHWDAVLLQPYERYTVDATEVADQAQYVTDVGTLREWIQIRSPTAQIIIHQIWPRAASVASAYGDSPFRSIDHQEEHGKIEVAINAALAAYPDLYLSAAGEAFALRDWDETVVANEMTGLWRYDDALSGVDGGMDASGHISNTAHLLTALIAYNVIYKEDSSDMRGSNIDNMTLNIPSTQLDIGANGINDVEDIIALFNLCPEIDDRAMTIADWDSLAVTADAVTPQSIVENSCGPD